MNITDLNWEKVENLMPAIVQDTQTQQVLMLGYMNQEALQKTVDTQQVTFYSRSKQRLWRKGETSGNTLQLNSIDIDCDADTLLIQATPNGPTCHNGTASCFNLKNSPWAFLLSLETLIKQRNKERPKQSYITSLFEAGIQRVAQKVGEEGVEVALAAVAQDSEQLKEEATDLLFHLMILLNAKNIELCELIDILKKRQNITE